METVVEAGPAEVYERAFVPALFAQWGPVVADAAGVAAGARVLDVGCGTGAATVAAAERAGRDGRVVGLDPNPEMLTVARRKPGIEWVEGRAEALPFRDAEFDAVVQPVRDDVLRGPGGGIAGDETSARPGRAHGGGGLRRGGGLAGLRCACRAAGPALRARRGGCIPGALRAGGREAMRALVADAGLRSASVVERVGEVRFPSIADLVATERACVWTLGGLLDEEQFAACGTRRSESSRPSSWMAASHSPCRH